MTRPVVLVVEDEPVIALDLCDLLEAFGYAVCGPAATVADALDRLRRARPDAALLDENLRGEGSEPVAAALAARAVPFLVLSGYARSATPTLAAAPRLSKPPGVARLRAALEALLAPGHGR